MDNLEGIRFIHQGDEWEVDVDLGDDILAIRCDGCAYGQFDRREVLPSLKSKPATDATFWLGSEGEVN